MKVNPVALTLSAAVLASALIGCSGGGGGGAVLPTPAPIASSGPSIPPGSVALNTIVPSSIESGIDPSYDAPVYFSPSVTSAKGKLFVFLAGTNGVPRLYQDILREGAVRGYHVIGLTYVNGTEVHDYCANSSDPACWGDVRSEIVYGNGTTNLLTVTPANSIVGRLTALLAYLSVTYPLNAYSTRRGSEYTLDQLSRFIDRGVRDRMERIAVGAPEVQKPTEPASPLLDLRALLRGRFGA